MSTRIMLLAVSNSSPFPIRLTVQYYPNLGGYLYIPEGQPETEGYEKGSIFKLIRYFNENHLQGGSNVILQYGDFTLYIWDNDVEVYIDELQYDDDNIGFIGHDESGNAYTGNVYRDYGTTTLNGTTYNYSHGEIYMYRYN